jgi:hypothetical protein
MKFRTPNLKNDNFIKDAIKINQWGRMKGRAMKKRVFSGIQRVMQSIYLIHQMPFVQGSEKL